jgi:hypothetical protein
MNTHYSFTLGQQQVKMFLSYSRRHRVVIIGTIPNDGRSKVKRRVSDVIRRLLSRLFRKALCQKVAHTCRILKFVVGIRVVIHRNNFDLHDWGWGVIICINVWNVFCFKSSLRTDKKNSYVCTGLITSFESGRLLILFNSNKIFSCKRKFDTH